LMSGVADEADVRAAFDRGAVGYFPKTMSGKALLQGIRMVLSGEHFVPMDPKTNNMMPSYYDDGLYNARASAGTVYSKSDAHKNSEIFSLTPRETEVLSYLMKGVSNKEIANELGLQVVTVKLHVRGVCRKLDVKNRTQAALKAQEYGLEIPDIRKHTA